MSSAFATVLLVVVGVAQVGVLLAQHRQHRIEVAESFRRRWADSREDWAVLVFVGRNAGDYYQVADRLAHKKLMKLVKETCPEEPAMWALQPVASVTSLLSDVCLQIAYGQLSVSDAHAIFGTAFLRQAQPLRLLLDPLLDANQEDDDHESDPA